VERVSVIAFTSCLLKVLEKMIYRRFQWTVESYFILPKFQAGFRNSRSCIDNLVVLNRIQSAFLQKDFIIATFLDIAGVFDNVIPRILFQDLRNLDLPACTCKVMDNFLSERSLFASFNGGDSILLTRAPLRVSYLIPCFSIFI